MSLVQEASGGRGQEGLQLCQVGGGGGEEVMGGRVVLCHCVQAHGWNIDIQTSVYHNEKEIKSTEVQTLGVPTTRYDNMHSIVWKFGTCCCTIAGGVSSHSNLG